MRYLLKSLVLVFLAAGLVACGKEGGLELSTGELEFKSSEQKQTVDVTADCSWTAASDCDWIVCSPARGEGDAALSITARQNDGLEREGTVMVSGGGDMCEIAVRQEGVDFSASSYSVELDQEGTPVVITITSKHDWEIVIPSTASWCKVSPSKGSAGETPVTVSAAPFTDRTPRGKQFITVNYGSTFSMIAVSQNMPNNDPLAPDLLLPEEGATGVKTNGTFTWRAASDPDGDAVKYCLMLSRDNGTTWASYNSTATSCKPSDLLEKNSRYVWKVKSLDDFGGEAESQTRSFITGDGGAYADGEILRYQTESAGAPDPVHLIIMGDGIFRWREI